MLYSIKTGKYVEQMKRDEEFRKWRAKLSDQDYQKIVEALNDIFDQSEINTAGWIPRHDWIGTVYEPIYEACGKNVIEAGMFFGLIVFDLLMNRNDKV